MKLLYRRCAGLDIHKDSIGVCIRIRNGGKTEAEIIEERFSPSRRNWSVWPNG
jgi:hypothetical protein